MQTPHSTRVLRTYVDAIIAPRIVAIKQSILSSTGLMTNMLNQSNSNAQETLRQSNLAQQYAQEALQHDNDSQSQANLSQQYSQQSLQYSQQSQQHANDSQTSKIGSDNNLKTMEAMIYSMNKVWLGVQSSDPTTDKNGDPLVPGTEYYNSSTNHVRVYRDDKQWHDQDESTEQEMNNAATSAGMAAGSAASAQGSATQAQNSANNAAGYANDSANHANASAGYANTAAGYRDDVNSTKQYLNTYWLGSFNSPPSTDRNGNNLTPGSWYFDTTTQKEIYWTGNGWRSTANAEDINEIRNDYVRVDGSNNMTGPLVLDLSKTNGPAGDWTQGVSIQGNDTYQNRWVSTPGFVAQIDQSPIRTFYATCNDKQIAQSYGRIRHCDGGGNWADFKFRNDGAFISSGDVWAGDNQNGNFKGYGTWMGGADLAECYKTLVAIPKGTIVSISTSDNPDQELDLAMNREDVFGVISTSPGAILNSQIEKGVPVGMVGRVPVRLLGPVKKGQKIYLSNKAGIGTADISRAVNSSHLGFSLESSDDVFEHLVEVALKF